VSVVKLKNRVGQYDRKLVLFFIRNTASVYFVAQVVSKTRCFSSRLAREHLDIVAVVFVVQVPHQAGFAALPELVAEGLDALHGWV
jgi:hypothetical protein